MIIFQVMAWIKKWLLYYEDKSHNVEKIKSLISSYVSNKKRIIKVKDDKLFRVILPNQC